MNDKYISLVAKYLSGEINDQEREKLFGLINSSDEHKVYFEEMQTLWEESSDVEEEPMSLNLDDAWQKVAGRINPSGDLTNEDDGIVRRFHFGQLLRIAAVFIGLVGAIWLWTQLSGDPVEMLVFQTLDDEKRELLLPDGSTVWLNENSSLQYLSDFEPRVIELKGEAFFNVQHLDSDASFEIQSGETITKVLGTSFNVRAYPEEAQVEVTVATGKVAFEKQKAKDQEEKVLLTAGQSGIYKKEAKNVVKQSITISNADAWKKEELVFEDTPLSKVIEDLERYFEIEIEVENTNILNCPLTGTYPNPKIDQLVQVLKFSLDLEVNQNEQKLLLSGVGCD
jgi:ferric-dicitrate binding protein FerR (iron transport regulator)